MVDQPDDVESGRHDFGVGEVLAHQSMIGRGQVDADDRDVLMRRRSARVLRRISLIS